MSADAIQSKIATGATLCFAPGTYVLNHALTLLGSTKLICTQRRSCILRGNDTFKGIIAEFQTTKQEVRGFVIEHFTSGVSVRDDGLIEDNEVRLNQEGIGIGTDRTKIRFNFVHANRQYGISGGPSSGTLIEGNELSDNNTAHLDPFHDAGGSKIVGSRTGQFGVTWRNNYVHDNYGNGIWSDGNVRNALYENNCVENNLGVGIDHEISYDAVIRNNIVRGNGTLDKGSCWHGAGIGLVNSQNVDIYGNTVDGIGVNPLCLVNSLRAEPVEFPQNLASVTVHENTFRMKGASQVGMVGESQPTGVRFYRNTYYVDVPTAANWAYFQYPLTKQQFQGAGQDADGTFLTW